MNLLSSAATSGDAGLGDRRRLDDVEEFRTCCTAELVSPLRERLAVCKAEGE